MGITDRSSVRAEVTGGGRSGGGGGGGQGSGGGRTARYSCLVRGLRFFYSRDGLGTKTSGRPDALDALTEAFPNKLINKSLQGKEECTKAQVATSTHTTRVG
jgi:hypothetical protein